MDYANESDITVRFTLLDRPPPIGDVTNPKLEPDLNTVANLLTTAINGGTFNVTMPASGQQTVRIVRPCIIYNEILSLFVCLVSIQQLWSCQQGQFTKRHLYLGKLD